MTTKDKIRRLAKVWVETPTSEGRQRIKTEIEAIKLQDYKEQLFLHFFENAESVSTRVQ